VDLKPFEKLRSFGCRRGCDYRRFRDFLDFFPIFAGFFLPPLSIVLLSSALLGGQDAEFKWSATETSDPHCSQTYVNTTRDGGTTGGPCRELGRYLNTQNDLAWSAHQIATFRIRFRPILRFLEKFLAQSINPV
jgi:hypothetical protein